MIEPVLAVRDLTVRYGTKRVLSSVDLSLVRGDWFFLLGPNGSGKTTLLRCVSGQMTPAAGTVSIGGLSLLNAPHAAKRLLGYAHPPQGLPGLLSGRQCLEVYAAAYDLPAVERGILELAAELRLTPVLDRWVASYSLGTRQKLSILLALSGSPALVVLDEAFNGLDPASAVILKRELQQRVGERRCAVLLATHALDSVLRHATRAGLLLDGALLRTWDTQQLDAVRRDGPAALETVLAEAVPQDA